MLHKSFKPAKCKTALNLAKSRIKLLKNKKEVHIRQLKRELALLMEAGQDQTARIRVEHVVREEKTMAAYELIEIYCELIAVRLPMIESQKHCPIDLKEAVTSLMFAAPRCADIPELQDVRKHFTAKYGKEFAAAAVELRPECGVSRTLVEKLAVKAPDGPTKVKILTAIAEEHNIKWEPNWFEDNDLKPPEDLLKGPNMEKVNRIQMEPLGFQGGPSYEQKHEAHSNVHDKSRSERNSQNIASADIDVPKMPEPAPYPDAGRSGTPFERMPLSPSSHRVDDTFTSGTQNWNMEFKDATAAAQAAAESAERASMAARAAAELSRQGNSIGKASTEEMNAFNHSHSVGTRVHSSDILRGENLDKSSRNSSSSERHPRMAGDQRDDTIYRRFPQDTAESRSVRYPELERTRRQSDYTVSGSRSSKEEFQDFGYSKHEDYGTQSAENPFLRDTEDAINRHYGSKPQLSASGDDFGSFSYSHQHNYRNDSGSSPYFDSGYGNPQREDRDVGKEESNDSPYFSTYSYGGKEDTTSLKQYGVESREDSFAHMDRGRSHIDLEEREIRSSAGAVFDDYGSDDDTQDNVFDPKGNGDTPNESAKDFPQVQDNSSKKWGVESPFSIHESQREHLESFAKTPMYSQSIAKLPVNFDDSDGEESDDGEMQQKSEVTRYADSRILRRDSEKQQYQPELSESFRESPIYSQLTKPLPVNFNDSDGEKSENEDIQQKSEVSKNTNYHDSVSTDLNRPEIYSAVDERKRQNSPQPLRFPSQISSHPASDTENRDETSVELNYGSLTGGLRNRGFTPPPYMRSPLYNTSSSSTSEQPASRAENKPSRRVLEKHLDTDSDDSETEITIKGSSKIQDPYRNETRGNVKQNLSYFDSDGSDSDEDVSNPPARKGISSGGLSQRTKVPAYRLVASQPSTKERTTPEPKLQPKVSIQPESSSSSSSSVRVKPVTPLEPNLSEKAPSRENSGKKPSHVHPKLPDFETLTAHLESLRSNRK